MNDLLNLYAASRVLLMVVLWFVAFVFVMLGWIQFQTWRNRRRYERMQSRLTLPYDQTGKDRLS